MIYRDYSYDDVRLTCLQETPTEWLSPWGVRMFLEQLTENWYPEEILDTLECANLHHSRWEPLPSTEATAEEMITWLMETQEMEYALQLLGAHSEESLTKVNVCEITEEEAMDDGLMGPIYAMIPSERDWQ